jgi:hypothetical protein
MAYEEGLIEVVNRLCLRGVKLTKAIEEFF